MSQQQHTQSVLMPDVGDVQNITLIAWSVAVGDPVVADQTLCTVETDKATVEVPAPEAGTVTACAVAPGAALQIGAVLCHIACAKGAPAAAVPMVSPGETASAGGTAPTDPGLEGASHSTALYAGPAARRIARMHGVALEEIEGTGRHGRITPGDVEAIVARAATALPTALPPDVRPRMAPQAHRVPLSRIKRISATRLTQSWTQIPHVTQCDVADVTALEAFRTAESARSGKLTLLPFVLKALVQTLRDYPQFNASLLEGGILELHARYAIGIAVDTPDGLVVPVLEDVDQYGIRGLAQACAALGEKARAKQLHAREMQGQTFTVSSLGGIGGTSFTPIINPPDVAILGLSKTEIRPSYVEGQWVPRVCLPLSLSYDHRVIDGAEGARFTQRLGQYLADIRTLLL